jgi:hypothetical protein
MKLPVEDWMLEVAEAEARPTEGPPSPNSTRNARFLLPRPPPSCSSAATEALRSEVMYVATTCKWVCSACVCWW